MMDENTSQETQVRFASHESTIESLTYAKEDLAKANGKIADLEAEVKRLTDELNEK